MPIFWFALSFTNEIKWGRAALIFFILHFLLYPASNGYNSYMDKDEGPIGGVAKPLPPTYQLLVTTVCMNVLALALSLIISWWFCVGVLGYIFFSKLYSNRRVRLKRFAILSYIIVIANQGALIFLLVQGGSSMHLQLQPFYLGMLASSLLIGGFYPISQVYQHQADAADGVTTISMLLGKRGTFIFCAMVYLLVFCLLFYFFFLTHQLLLFGVIQIFFIPVSVSFFLWFLKVCKHENAANFANTMQMNWLASTCTNLAFVTLLIIKYFG